MAYSADWSNSIIIDHTKFNQTPAAIRALRLAISERLTNMFYGFTSGETQTYEGVKNLPYVVQVADPGATADKIKLYGKDVSGKVELHAQDEDGDVIQLTDGGKINAAALGGVYAVANLAALANVMNYIYPVGSVVTLGVSTNPATLFGVGTWTAIAGKVIVGIDAGQTEFDTLDETGGAKTHTLSIAEMPAHDHASKVNDSSGGSLKIPTYVTQGGSINADVDTGETGGGGAHNNLQPYIVKYVWQRTA